MSGRLTRRPTPRGSRSFAGCALGEQWFRPGRSCAQGRGARRRG
jgi:hypothetical protein